jgi:AAA+ superfamily predicted ATPase
MEIIKKLKKEWLDYVKEKYETAKKSNGSLGKFLKKYPLKFKEFCCMLDLIEDNNDKSDFEMENGIRESKEIFKKHKVRYESSQLRRFKLIFRIIHPLRPMKAVYEVSYKAQLALKNRKYTDEYQQLDMGLEEESKRNSPDELESLYYIIESKFNFNDLVASEKLMKNLKSALSRETNKDKIFKDWGLGKVIEYGRGTTLNFRGPPGTGKTLAANCLAKELNKKLLMVRYDQLQNCFVGVTEKHIQMVFKIAKAKNAVLFFDEADAIALSRKNLEKSWEMSQVNTLLKELERFDGVCIFATNFAEKYDTAFERRLTMHIDFDMPNKEQCIKILDKILPKKSRDKKLSLNGLNLNGFSGGDIKNIVLNAAGIASRDKSDKIKRKHIREALALVKSGKSSNENKDLNYIS